jgi:hypothetical protein
MDNSEQDKLNQELTQANKAKALFQDPLLKESFDKLRTLYSESLFNTGATETDAREKLWLAYNVVNKVEQNLLEMIDTGKLAAKQLEDYRKSIKNKKF